MYVPTWLIIVLLLVFFGGEMIALAVVALTALIGVVCAALAAPLGLLGLTIVGAERAGATTERVAAAFERTRLGAIFSYATGFLRPCGAWLGRRRWAALVTTPLTIVLVLGSVVLNTIAMALLSERGRDGRMAVIPVVLEIWVLIVVVRGARAYDGARATLSAEVVHDELAR